ncbi:MAG TPA: transcriptional regulator, partial [Chromatiaceae bacterium]|nr:transcriptional regulator [Chromatiaceae bacterium]
MNEPTGHSIPEDEDPTMTANALKAMAHPLRWKILCTL